MSRIMVIGTYEGSNYVLRQTGGEDAGKTYTEIEPDTYLRVGNSIGGFFARAITYAGQAMIAIHRCGGSEMGMPVPQARRQFRDKNGLLLRPGMVGLWATSSGSARNGLFHRYSPPGDEVEKSLEEGRHGRRCLHRVNKIDVEVEDGGALCSHQTGGGSGYRLRHDGTEVEIVPPRYAEGHANQYHEGCCEAAGTYRVAGATFVIQWHLYQPLGGGWSSNLRAVYITPQAELATVAALIRAGAGR